MAMHVEVVTLFPEMVEGALRFGVLGRAIERGLLSVGTEDPRRHTQDVHRTVDDRPYGGGPGMVLKPEPMLAAIRAAAREVPTGSPRIYLSAQGERLTQEGAQELAALPGFVLVAGRYEGLDERVIELGIDRELSIGDYVLSGGELPALVVIDAVARLIARRAGRRALECGRVVRAGAARLAALHAAGSVRGSPRCRRCYLSGDHADIRRWRLKAGRGAHVAAPAGFDREARALARRRAGC